ncbi:MAG: N-acyl homoserine lactonase family protein [Hyphomonadaceae bacterium]
MIWDTGFGDALAEQSEGMRVEEMHATFSVPLRLADQLAQIGVDPADIDYISFSHSHADHTGNAVMFPNAVWIVDADERAFMFSDEARATPEFQAYARLENAETQLIEGDADYDVFGDGTVKIIQAPGHTPGHTVLLAQLPHAGAVLLTGDMYHLSESRSRSLVPRFNTDRAQTLASMEKIERIARENDALVIRQHVREDFDAMPRFPDALN